MLQAYTLATDEKTRGKFVSILPMSFTMRFITRPETYKNKIKRKARFLLSSGETEPTHGILLEEIHRSSYNRHKQIVVELTGR